MGYLTAVARTDLGGELNYTDRNIVEKLFQTYTMRIGRFHETWNGSQTSAERWLTAYTAYYNHHRSHQALDDQPPFEHSNRRAQSSSASPWVSLTGYGRRTIRVTPGLLGGFKYGLW